MKKLLALLLTLTMSVSLAACGGGGENQTEEPASSAPAQSDSGNVSDDAAEGTVSAGEDLTWGLTPFEERQTLRLGFFTGSPLSYPFLFADNLGVFDALNIDVEYTCFTGGPAMMEANAEWDMASCGLGGLANGLYGYDFSLVDLTDYEDRKSVV